MSIHRTIRRGATLACLITAATLMAGCASNGDPDGTPSGSLPTRNSHTASSPSATPTDPAWKTNFTKKQLSAYDEALDRWSTYEQRSEPIWAKGEATPAARQLFQEFFPSPLWQDLYQQLAGYEAVRIKISGIPDVLWSKPTRIAIKGSTASVTIVQCLDFAPVELTQRGEPQESYQFPVQRTVIVNHPKGFPWLIYDVQAPAGKDFKRCDPGKDL